MFLILVQTLLIGVVVQHSSAFSPSFLHSSQFGPSTHNKPTHRHMFGFGKKKAENDFDGGIPSTSPSVSSPPVVTDVRGGADAGFITNSTGFIVENIPGKIVLSVAEIEEQKKGLAVLEKKYADDAEEAFNEKEALVGWTKQAEMVSVGGSCCAGQ